MTTMTTAQEPAGTVSSVSRLTLVPSCRLGRLLTVAAACYYASHALSQTGEAVCGDPFKSWFGPFDYRTAPKGALENVETHHFTPQVEQMIRGVTTGVTDMGKDVAYVLGVFPNHHRALFTMMRLGERDRNEQPRGANLPIECWFDRAVRYARDDTVARLLYAMWLRKKGRTEDSLAQTRTAEQFAKENPLTHYNIGMSYFELGQYDKAAASAVRAREMGLSRPELIDRLKGAKKWVEPQ